ncbi:MAG TPA: efflux transporter outer membrane subunit [Verrucomicrobiae bacterium]|jgi:multidrug efflux system outer membrane protein
MKNIFPLLPPLAAILAAAGCAVGPNYKAPPLSAPPKFSAGIQPGLSTNEPVAAWWRGFGDAELTRLVERAAASNLDLRIATANLLQARALRLGAKADFFPVAGAAASYNNVKYSEAEVFNAPGANLRQQLYDAGFDATWELDIFGRVRRAYQASTASMEAAAATLQDTRVSLVAEVALNYFDLRGVQNELAVLRRNAGNQRETLKITQERLEAGRGTDLDVSRARAQLDNTLSQIPPLESTETHAMHRLGVLTGQQPEAMSDELGAAQPLPALPPLVAIGDPAQLLRRRPDVRAAERNLAAATAGIGVAVADLWPRVTFNGAIGLDAESFTGLGKRGSDTRSFGPSITWAALDYAHVRSRIKAAGAVADAQLARYQEVVLTSLEETENALADFGKAQARRDYLAESVKASQSAADLAHAQFDNGATDFLTVLDAERVLLESQDQLAQTQTQTAAALVAVYKSLAGGWEQPSKQ